MGYKKPTSQRTKQQARFFLSILALSIAFIAGFGIVRGLSGINTGSWSSSLAGKSPEEQWALRRQTIQNGNYYYDFASGTVSDHSHVKSTTATSTITTEEVANDGDIEIAEQDTEYQTEQPVDNVIDEEEEAILDDLVHTTAGDTTTAEIDPNAPRCPALSKELFDKVAVKNTVMLAVINAQQMPFFRNWLTTLKNTGITYFIIGTTDLASSQTIQGMGLPCFESFVEMKSETPLLWGSDGWRRMTWEKVFVVEKVVDWGFKLIISDVDVVWFKDPMAVLPERTDADILFSTDIVWSTNEDPEDFSLDILGNANINLNTGVYFLYPGQRSSDFIKAWVALYETSTDHDQNTVYTILRQGVTNITHPNNDRVRSAFNEKLWIGVVPAYIVTSGHSHMVSELYKLKGKSLPMAMHATWTYSGLQGKMSRIREAQMWFDPPEYYSQGNFVTVDLRVPEMPEDFNDWEEYEPGIVFHLTALQQQLEQIYIGLSIAAATNRIFILPRLTCFCDKSWYAMYRCRLDDASAMKFPVTCPADYYLMPDNFDSPSLPGTRIQVREHSFLENPRTPADVKSSSVAINFKDELNLQSCIDAIDTPQRKDQCTKPFNTVSTKQGLTLPPGLNDKQLIKALDEVKDVRVWKLRLSTDDYPEMWKAYAGFECKSQAKEFEDRMKEVMGDGWCCRWPELASKVKKPEREEIRMTANGPLWDSSKMKEC